MPLRITTWNVEHARRLVTANPSASILGRRRRVRETVEEIDPDILCLVEGSKGAQPITDVCQNVLGGSWVPILLRGPNDAPGDRNRDYRNNMSGTQWIWFLAKPATASSCRDQNPDVWNSFVGLDQWTVNYWGQIGPDNHGTRVTRWS